MPIRGLSDRDSVQPRFRNVGKLRKGAAKGGNRPGRDLEWFRFVPDNERADVLQAFEDTYGPEPDRLQVYLPFDTMEENFRSAREAYGANHLCKLRCDGELWHDWIKEDRHYHSAQGEPCTLKFKDVENRCPECPCGYYGYLSVILPEFWIKYPDYIGLVTVVTTSINDIANLAAKLVQWEPLTNKPFVLWREHQTIGIPIKGKRAAKSVSLLHLELTEQEMVRVFLSAGSQANLLPEHIGPEWNVSDDEQEMHDWGEYEEHTGDPFLDGDFTGAPMDADAYEDLTDDNKEREGIAATKGDPPVRGTIVVSPDVKVIDLGYIPDWIDTDKPRQWGKLYFEAVQHLGFDNDHRVMGALAKVFNLDKWNEHETDENYRTAWNLLAQHQRSKEGEE